MYTTLLNDLRGMFDGARILVAPLDWGLGHAARCVPIIRALLERDAVPVIGADKGPLALLCGEFPMLEHVRIAGFEVRYGVGRSQAWTMARQFPAMLHFVRKEQRSFNGLRKGLRLDAVISDQRFGIRANDLPSVIITHQIFPFAPVATGLLQRIDRHYIGRFHRCWVPDGPEAPGLAGALSHGTGLPRHGRYIGPVSRFADGGRPLSAQRHRVVAVVSGPEPQRTAFENKVREQLATINGPHLIISGKPGKRCEERTGPIRVLPHLSAKDLRDALWNAELIVGRTGYTTLMDLHALGRSALLVPTPGQLEQEYLGTLHAGLGGHVVQRQDAMEIAPVLSDPPRGAAMARASTALADALADLSCLIGAHRPSTFTR